MSFFISPAMADTHGAAGPAGDISGIIFLVGFALIFYFLMWRPQSKRAKEHKELINGLNKGDEVVTNGGLMGKVTRVSDDYVVLKVAENTELKFQKSYITQALPKGSLKDI